jgi:23S rRNA (uridine2552-2'-O)-methyltransferase
MAYNPQDRYYKRAKQEGYRSRAAYKLLELQQRFRLIRPGDVVVDLGAAPGGWLQLAAKWVGPTGKVIGIDLQPIDAFRQPNITVLQADITAPEVPRKIQEIARGKVHSVLSDLAPRLSGIRDADAAHCLELNRSALILAIALLQPGGSFLVKSFVNEELQTFTLELKRLFSSVQRTRPEATRQGSSEFYFFAKGFHENPQTQ